MPLEQSCESVWVECAAAVTAPAPATLLSPAGWEFPAQSHPQLIARETFHQAGLPPGPNTSADEQTFERLSDAGERRHRSAVASPHYRDRDGRQDTHLSRQCNRAGLGRRRRTASTRHMVY